MEDAVEQVTSACLPPVASPTYKGTYTGLLKVFLDRLDYQALSGVTALPLLVMRVPQHALAVDVHLRPLLTELGAAVPGPGLAFLESDLDRAASVLDRGRPGSPRRWAGPRPGPAGRPAPTREPASPPHPGSLEVTVMGSNLRQLHFNAFLTSSGHHEAAWRLPQSNPFANTDLAHWRHLAQTAERAAFDSVFLADSPALWNSAKHRPAGSLEPTVLLTALATATTYIGLIATALTSYNSPFNLARRFASLDHISGGRAGWNIVTTAERSSAQNFGRRDRPSHHERYERATEFVEVSQRLWDSWEDDAELGDKAAACTPTLTASTGWTTRGATSGSAAAQRARSPQGRPLLVQAGSSEDGREFAARYAEAIFTAQQTLEDGQQFYADMKRRARRLGRDVDLLKILPGSRR